MSSGFAIYEHMYMKVDIFITSFCPCMISWKEQINSDDQPVPSFPICSTPSITANSKHLLPLMFVHSGLSRKSVLVNENSNGSDFPVQWSPLSRKPMFDGLPCPKPQFAAERGLDPCWTQMEVNTPSSTTWGMARTRTKYKRSWFELSR